MAAKLSMTRPPSNEVTTVDSDVTKDVLWRQFGDRNYEFGIRDDAEIGTLPSDRAGSSFVMTCASWMRQNRYLVWRVNPHDVNWTLRLRQVDQPTRSGSVPHTWINPIRGTFFDEPVLRFSFQSGNIMPIPTLAQYNESRARTSGIRDVLARETLALREAEVRDADRELQKGERALWDAIKQTDPDAAIEYMNDREIGPHTLDAAFKAIKEIRAAQRRVAAVDAKKAAAEKDISDAKLRQEFFDMRPGVPPGLHNFYQFLSLMDEQRIITDPSNPSFGQMNLIYVTYNSNIFPQLTLIGTFAQDGTSWTDSAKDPNQVNSWSASMTVYGTAPQLNAEALIETFRQMGFRRSIA